MDIYIYTCVFIYTYIHIYMYICIYMHIYIQRWAPADVYICIHICIYIYIQRRSRAASTRVTRACRSLCFSFE